MEQDEVDGTCGTHTRNTYIQYIGQKSVREENDS
jgi:hypothetical protein